MVNDRKPLTVILMNSFPLMIRYLREKNYVETDRKAFLYAIVKPIFFGTRCFNNYFFGIMLPATAFG